MLCIKLSTCSVQCDQEARTGNFNIPGYDRSSYFNDMFLRISENQSRKLIKMIFIPSSIPISM